MLIAGERRRDLARNAARPRPRRVRAPIVPCAGGKINRAGRLRPRESHTATADHLAKAGPSHDHRGRRGAGREEPATGLGRSRSMRWKDRVYGDVEIADPDILALIDCAHLPAASRGPPGRAVGHRLRVQGRDPVRAQPGRLSAPGPAGGRSQGAGRRAAARHLPHRVLARRRFRGHFRRAGPPREPQAGDARPPRHRDGRRPPRLPPARLLRRHGLSAPGTPDPLALRRPARLLPPRRPGLPRRHPARGRTGSSTT